MPSPSKVDRLPGPLKEALADLWYSRRYSLDQLKQWLDDVAGGRLDLVPRELADLPADAIAIQAAEVPSRSGLHRHVQGLDKLAERLHRSRAVAEGLVRQLGKAPESRQMQLNVELLHSVVTDVFLKAEAAEEGEEISFDAKTIHDLAKSLDHLASARKKDADLILKVREEVAKEAAKKVEAAAREAKKAGEDGLSGERIDRLMRELAGMA